MTTPPTRYLMMDTTAISLLSYDHSLEEIGAALLLVSHLSRGHRVATEDHKRRVCQIEKRVWTRIGPSVLAATDKLIASSEPRPRFGRPSLPKATRERILARDGARCRYCKTKAGPFHIDHIHPVSKGGTSRDENLCVACAPCNFAKAAKVGSEWNY